MTQLRFGKHAPKNDYRTLRLTNYLKSSLPAPPAFHDALAQVYAKIKVSDPTKLFPMDGNDQYGDCTIAALAHAATVYNGLTGHKKIMAQAAATKLYFHLTGGADSGLNGLDFLNYWQSNMAAGEKILAFVKIDIKNQTHVQQAKFGNRV